MGFLNGLGQKLKNVASIGAKVLAKAGDIGHKVSNTGGAILGALNNAPVVGELLNKAPVISSVNNALKAGLGAAGKLAYAADAGATALSAFSGGDYNRAAKLAQGGAQIALKAVKDGIEKGRKPAIQ